MPPKRIPVKKARILVVDDEPSILKYVRASLQEEGYEVVEAADGEQALHVIEEALPDLVILDITMPRLDGFEVCQRIREWSQVPVIMLSGRTSEQDKVKSLRLGADDYLVKPFGVNELLARVEAVLRRFKVTIASTTDPSVTAGELEVNFAERSVKVAGQEIRLTPTEYSLLRQLIIHRGKVLTHRMLLHEVWGPEYGEELEYVHVFINRLRHKLGDDPDNPKYISNVPGVGYRFAAGP